MHGLVLITSACLPFLPFRPTFPKLFTCCRAMVIFFASLSLEIASLIVLQSLPLPRINIYWVSCMSYNIACLEARPFSLHELLNGIPKTMLTKGDRHILEIGIKGFLQLLYRCSLLRLPLYDTHVQNSGDKASYSIVPCIFSKATSIDISTFFHSKLVWFLAPCGSVCCGYIIVFSFLLSACSSKTIFPEPRISTLWHHHPRVPIWHTMWLASHHPRAVEMHLLCLRPRLQGLHPWCQIRICYRIWED